MSDAKAKRGIFCNRNMDLRSINAIGYDMDYTLVHYQVEPWEEQAYDHLKKRLLDSGWPVADLEFDPSLVSRGLVIDKELGNILKVDGFGYVKRASHGGQMLPYRTRRRIYSRIVVDLKERERYSFLNTLFSLSEGCMFSQLVDLLDERALPEVLGYRDLYLRVRSEIDEAHMEGKLKAEIIAQPKRYVALDQETPLALLDQRKAGKKLLLITNSEWYYTKEIMSYAYDPFLPGSMTWRDLFDIIIVSARKPEFFTSQSPAFEIVNEDGLLRPHVRGQLKDSVYVGGNAGLVEQTLRLSGKSILYVGDHIYSDVHASKNLLRWRTALVLRELEEELVALGEFSQKQSMLSARMATKRRSEFRLAQIRLHLQRLRADYGPAPEASREELEKEEKALTAELDRLDGTIAPLAQAGGQLCNPRWGPLMRAGKDKSKLAWQVEQYADIYTSRVSNFLEYTPFSYFRSPRGALPHDPGLGEVDWSGNPQDDDA